MKKSFEPFRTLAHGDGMYTFSIYTDFILIKTKKITKLKILNREQFDGGVKYGLENDHHLNYILELHDNGTRSLEYEPDIRFEEYLKDNTKHAISMIVCRKG
jgi:hypothetical protein